MVFKPCPLEDFGKKIELEAMLFEIPFDEAALLQTLCYPEIRSPSALVEIHWTQFLVDHVDIRKRSFLVYRSEDLRFFDFEEFITSPEGIQALENSDQSDDPFCTTDRTPINTKNVSALCDHCGLSSHPSNRCFKNNPGLLEGFRKARRERKKKNKAAKKLRMTNA